MMDPERERIRAQAKAEADNENWKQDVDKRIAKIETSIGWGIKAVAGAAAYLAAQLYNFLSGGGVIK